MERAAHAVRTASAVLWKESSRFKHEEAEAERGRCYDGGGRLGTQVCLPLECLSPPLRRAQPILPLGRAGMPGVCESPGNE